MKDLKILAVALLMTSILSILSIVGCDEQKFPTITPTGIDFILNYDKDGDMKVSLDEYRYDDFFAYDVNADGFIVLVETPQDSKMNPNKVAFILKYDKDGDSKVSPEEFYVPTSFSSYDLNNDGFIDMYEAPEMEWGY